MELNRLKSVYAHEGPFVTVYLEGRSPGEDAAKQVRLRWQALRSRLENEDADPKALDAVETALAASEAGEEQANGRVIVTSAADGVVLDEPWDAALGRGDAAHSGVLPELGPYIREGANAVRALLVIAGQEHAELRRLVVAEQHVPEELSREEARGSAVEEPHHTREGALSHRRIQRRADEAVSQNAKDIAAKVERASSAFHPRVLILAGEVQGRTAVREELPGELTDILAETDRGGSGDRGAEEALADEVLRIVGEKSEESARHWVSQLEEGLAHGRAAKGDPDVVKAAEMGALDTLLFEDGAKAKREALLLKVAAETSASFALVPEGTGLTDGVGGLLRFPPEG
ncbi:baeRF2 domain-containing protein [Streptomyces sp. NPDC054796]